MINLCKQAGPQRTSKIKRWRKACLSIQVTIGNHTMTSCREWTIIGHDIRECQCDANNISGEWLYNYIITTVEYQRDGSNAARATGSLGCCLLKTLLLLQYSFLDIKAIWFDTSHLNATRQLTRPVAHRHCPRAGWIVQDQ